MSARLILVAAAAVAAATLSPAVAPAAAPRTCRSADLRYPFQAGGPKDFGVFRLTISGGRCATAHRVAKAWMTRFEANLRAGSATLPKRVAGYTFKSLPAHEAQTYRLRGRRGPTTIRFDYRVPNG